MWQILLVFLVPLMLSNVLQSASQTMASIWIGRSISTQALGAISAVFPIVFLLFSFVFGVSSGASVLIGQAFGAGDHHKVKKIAGTVIGAALYLGIIVAIVGFFGSPDHPGVAAHAARHHRAIGRVRARALPDDADLLRLLRLRDDLARHRRLHDALLRAYRLGSARDRRDAALHRRRLRPAEARRRQRRGGRRHRQLGGICVAALLSRASRSPAEVRSRDARKTCGSTGASCARSCGSACRPASK